jgi:hypothetical protein
MGWLEFLGTVILVYLVVRKAIDPRLEFRGDGLYLTIKDDYSRSAVKITSLIKLR